MKIGIAIPLRGKRLVEREMLGKRISFTYIFVRN